MIVRLVKMSFREDEVEAFQAIFASSKDKIRSFPGNRHVELLQSETTPNVFFTYSHWDNAEALENYRHSELFADTWSRTKVLFNDKPQAWSTHVAGEGQLLP